MVLEGLQPGEVVITSKFAGVPVVQGAKVNAGSPLDVALKALAPNQFMPTTWTEGPLPLTTEGYAALVRPYNSALAADIDILAERSDILGGVSNFINDSRNKTLLIVGGVALAYLLVKR